MYISYLNNKAQHSALTCSDVVQLLHEQPTADETSHAHLHLSDGFRSDPSKILANNWNSSQEETDWKADRRTAWDRPDSHLFPANQNPLPTFNSATPSKPPDPNKVYADQARLAQSDKYNQRMGLGEIAKVDPSVQKYPGYFVRTRGNPATNEVILEAPQSPANDLLARNYLGGRDPNNYVLEKGSANQIKIVHSANLNRTIPGLPRVPASEAHTMFEDSESMVLHLTAALISAAGLKMLSELKKRGHNEGKTIALFSHTAVRIVAEKTRTEESKGNTKAVGHRLIERTADVQDPHDRNRVLTGTFTSTPKAIDHIVVVMAVSPTNQALVMTCFPDPRPTNDTIQRASTKFQDIVELVYKSEDDSDYLTIEQSLMHAAPRLIW